MKGFRPNITTINAISHIIIAIQVIDSIVYLIYSVYGNLNVS